VTTPLFDLDKRPYGVGHSALGVKSTAVALAEQQKQIMLKHKKLSAAPI
jgi:hypothetical protein